MKKCCDEVSINESLCVACSEKQLLKWTSDLPTREGIYSMKRPGYEPEWVYVDGNNFYPMMEEVPCKLIHYKNCEWYGPIEPPEYKED